jgi:hypothetical protein
MSNRTDLSNLRALLHDTRSDVQGLTLRVIPIEAAGDINRAYEALSAAIGHLTDALTHDVDMTAEQAFGVRL